MFQTELGKIEMTFWRGRDVDDIRLGPAQKLIHVTKVLLNRKPLVELLGHERFTVAHAHDLAVLDDLNRRRVGVRDFAAPDDGNLKHVVLPAHNFGNSGVGPPPLKLSASSQAWSSISYCYSVSFSSTRATVAY